MIDIPRHLRKTRFFEKVLLAAAGVVGVVALVVIFGWFTKQENIIQIAPQFAPMQFNTALLFLFSSLGTVLMIRDRQGSTRVVGAFLLLFASLTLSEYIFGFTLVLDELFMDAHTVIETSHPGRMAPNTAVGFMLVGASLICCTFDIRRRHIGAGLASLLLMVALLALYGYIARAENAYGWGDLTRMAVHTGICFFILALTLVGDAWMRSVQDRGWRFVPRWLTFAVAVTALTAGLCAWNSVVILEQRKNVEEAEERGLALSASVKETLDSDVRAIVRMADRHSLGMRGPGWVSDAENYLRDMDGLFGVAVYGDTLVKDRVIVRDAAHRAVVSASQVDDMLAEATNRVTISSTIPGLPGGFVIASRIDAINDDGDPGFLLCYFDSETFFSSAIRTEEDELTYIVETENEEVLAGAAPAYDLLSVSSRNLVEAYGEVWIITVFPMEVFAITEVGLKLSTLLLGASFIIALLIYLIAGFARKSYHSQMERTDGDVRLANEELETLLYIVSHDLKEPLRSLTSFSMILNEDHAEDLDAEGRDILRRIGRGGERMVRLLDDVMVISEAQKLVVSSEVVSLQAIVDGQVERLSSEIEESEATVKVGEDLPDLKADQVWVSQAVHNLIGNALKFTKKGEKPVVEIERYEGPEGVGLIVKDRGTGVPGGNEERIFEVFRRGVGAEVEGTGLGLAIVKKVAQKHGGKVWFQNRHGGGTEFYMTFGTARG